MHISLRKSFEQRETFNLWEWQKEHFPPICLRYPGYHLLGQRTSEIILFFGASQKITVTGLIRLSICFPYRVHKSFTLSLLNSAMEICNGYMLPILSKVLMCLCQQRMSTSLQFQQILTKFLQEWFGLHVPSYPTKVIKSWVLATNKILSFWLSSCSLGYVTQNIP